MTDEDWIRAELNRCWPWLESALDRYPVRTHDKEHVLDLLLSGDASIWPTPRSCVVAEIKSWPTGAKVLHVWLAGGDLAEILKTDARLDAYAREHGCTHRSLCGRRGWLRQLEGYREASTTMTKELA